MKRIFKSYLFSCLLLLLYSCQLAVDVSTTTEKETTRIVKAFKIQAENGQTDYYPIYYDPINYDSDLEFSLYFGSVHIELSENTEKIKMDYFIDTDTLSCLNISFINLNYEPLTEKTICDNTVKISYDDVKSYQIEMTLIDIDYLESYEVVQFDENNNKITNDFIRLHNKEHNILIDKNTADFMTVEKYQDHNGNYYYVRTLYHADNINKSYNQRIVVPVNALDINNNRVHYVFSYTVEKDGGMEL